MTSKPNLINPVWLALVTAILWGIWWLPVRELQAAGLSGPWAAVAMSAGTIPVLVALYLTARAKAPMTPRAMVSGMLIGIAITLYSGSITETTVVRAVLLFYLAPAWSIAIECLFMGRKFNRLNALAFALAAAGVVLIFRGDVSFAGWNIGDMMALGSGICWALGAALVFSGEDVGARRMTVFGVLASILVGCIIAVASGADTPTGEVVTRALPIALIYGTLYLTPLLVATLWTARRLNPATLSFLLTGEIISGIVSSAYLLDEPFGLPEICGALLIISAAMIEVVMPKENQLAR